MDAHRLDPREPLPREYYTQETLTGNWDGNRTWLHDQGFDFLIEIYGDTFANFFGNQKRRGDFTGYIHGELNINAEKLMGWKGAHFLFLGFATFSTDPSVSIQTSQTVSNLEATDTAKLFEAWLEQFLFSNSFSIKLGLYSLDTEFDFKETANFFVNGVFGTGLDLSDATVQGPAIYAVSALGVRFKLELGKFYIQSAIVDGIPGDPDNPHGTQVVLDQDDGLLFANEMGYKTKGSQFPRFHIGIGAWIYSTNIPDRFLRDTSGNPILKRGRYGVYGFFDLRLYSESKNSDQGLDVFFRVGNADTNSARFDLNISGGIVYTGLFSFRNKDRAGLAISSGWAGDSLLKASRQAGAPLENEEIVMELTYEFVLEPWLSIQPDLQWFLNPGLNPNFEDVLFLGLRFEIIL